MLSCFVRGIKEGHTPEVGRPTGRGKPWLRQPMDDRTKAVLVKTLETVLARLKAAK